MKGIISEGIQKITTISELQEFTFELFVRNFGTEYLLEIITKNHEDGYISDATFYEIKFNIERIYSQLQFDFTNTSWDSDKKDG